MNEGNFNVWFMGHASRLLYVDLKTAEPNYAEVNDNNVFELR